MFKVKMDSYQKMCNVFLSFIVIIEVHVDARIGLTISGDRVYADGVECNSNVLVQCKAPVNTNTMTWTLNGQYLGECTFGMCVHLPSVPYIFTFNTTAGVFDIALNPVSWNETNANFTCDDGNDLNETSITVTSDYSINGSIERLAENQTRLEVITGCIIEYSDVNFDWILLENITSADYTPLKNSPTSILSSTEHDAKFCLSDVKCGGSGRARQKKTLTITEADNAKSYYVGVNVSYVGFVSHNRNYIFTDRSYKIEVNNTCSKRWCIQCWKLGVIPAVIFAASLLHVVLIKGLCSNCKIGSLHCWETFALIGICAVVICLIVIVVVAYVCKDCSETKRHSFDCWAIYLILLGICVFCWLCCMTLYILKEPVSCLKVVSRKIIGNGMTISIQWQSRLNQFKTFYAKLNNEKDTPLQECKIRNENGVLEYELTDLKLDSDYSGHVFSTMCKIQSLRYQIDFDTKGRALPPYKLCEDEQQRTESSVTVSWKSAKDPKQHFFIKYRRTKGHFINWMVTERINDNLYTIEGLKPGTSYTLIMYAENEIGPSEESKALFVKTRSLRPVPPENFSCISVKDNEVTLSWKPFKNIKKQEFILTVFNMSEELSPGQKGTCTQIRINRTGKKVMTHTVTELKPSSKYMFEIFTASGKLISESSAIAVVTTEGIVNE